jgi:hypothetical protein
MNAASRLGLVLHYKHTDAESISAKWEEANMAACGQRIILWHLGHIFRHRLIVPKEVRDLERRALPHISD